MSRPIVRPALVLGALLAVLALPVGTVAQSALPSARLIPVDGMGFELRMSPDGTTAAVFDQAILLDNEVDAERLPIRLVDLASGDQVGALDGFTDYAADVAFAPDGSSLASLHWNGELYRWNLGATGPEPVGPFLSGGIANSRIAFLPDSRTVLARVGYAPQRFYEYDTETGAIPHVIGVRPETWAGFRDQYLQGVPLDITYPSFAVSPDGSTLATVTSNSEVALWSIPNGQPEVIRPKAETGGCLVNPPAGVQPGRRDTGVLRSVRRQDPHVGRGDAGSRSGRCRTVERRSRCRVTAAPSPGPRRDSRTR